MLWMADWAHGLDCFAELLKKVTLRQHLADYIVDEIQHEHCNNIFRKLSFGSGCISLQNTLQDACVCCFFESCTVTCTALTRHKTRHAKDMHASWRLEHMQEVANQDGDQQVPHHLKPNASSQIPKVVTTNCCDKWFVLDSLDPSDVLGHQECKEFYNHVCRRES